MKKIFLITILFAGVVSSAAAQGKWSLRQCIDYAVENNIEIQQTALSVESAEIELNTSQNSRLPNLAASMGHSFSWGLDTDYFTGLKQTSTQMSTSMGVSTGIPVFQGMRINNQIKQNKLNLQAAVESLNRAKENMELAVTGYYLEVLFQKEILHVYREQVALTREQVTKTEELVKSGKVAESQLFDIRSQLASDEVNEINAQNSLALALLDLSQALNIEWTPSFDIVVPDLDNAVIDNLSSLQSPDYIYQTAVGIRPAVREAEYRLEGSEYQVKIAKSAYYPNLSFGASFGDGYRYRFGTQLDSSGNVITQDDFWTQLKNGYNVNAGFNLSIPIFNRNQTRNSVRSAKLNVQNYSLQLENVKVALYKEIQQAFQRAVAAQARHEATGKALAAAEESFRAMQLRYDYGKATVYEYNETQTKLISSKSERVQAKYDYLFRTKILDFYEGKEIDL